MKHKYTNKLIDETSPYLQQHAHNPVKWYPWGDEALEKARKEDKPILVSIGYSSCHWCHVMEKESFTDEKTAEIMNSNFICIKVDREERPDLDEIYMLSCQFITGAGGWPLNVFLSPDLKPFYAGTYFPLEPIYGRQSWKKVLLEIAQLYRNNKGKILNLGEQITAMIEKSSSYENPGSGINPAVIDETFISMKQRYDPVNGGFGTQPKFPDPLQYFFLLRYFHKTKNPEAFDIVNHSVKKMAMGGMYDQIGGGFHRYSTDSTWLKPHFEKMLYDNALLAGLYFEAYQIKRDTHFLRTGEEILEYIRREMTSPEGGFYSAQDADTEGVEGKYFTWFSNEIRDILENDTFEQFKKFYGISEVGNFEGRNILHIKIPLPDDENTDLIDLIDKAKRKLLTEREKRDRPLTDTKILTAWNGLMISGFVKGYMVTGKDEYLRTAKKAAEYIWTNLYENGTLYRTVSTKGKRIKGFLNDYVFYCKALLDLYSADYNSEWLKRAFELIKLMISKFYDTDNGGFFSTEAGTRDLITRLKDPYDKIIPSGNSIALHNLYLASRLTDNNEYRKIIEKTLSLFSQVMEKNPPACASLSSLMDAYLSPAREIVITGNKDDEKTKEILRDIRKSYLCDTITIFVEPQKMSELSRLLPLIKDKMPVNNQTTVFICENFTCRTPLVDWEKAKKIILA